VIELTKHPHPNFSLNLGQKVDGRQREKACKIAVWRGCGAQPLKGCSTTQALLLKPFVHRGNDNRSVELNDPALQIFRFYRQLAGENTCGTTIHQPSWLRTLAVRQ